MDKQKEIDTKDVEMKNEPEAQDTEKNVDFTYLDGLLKDSYSIDDESFHEEDEKSESESNKKSSSRDSLFSNFISAIKEDDVAKIESICKNSQCHHIINRTSPEGYTPLHYAVLYSHIKSIEILIDHNANIETHFVEGLPLLHLSLTFAMFQYMKQKAINCFNYLMKKYPDLIVQKDRLGRSILHLIIEFDISECLMVEDIKDYLMKDNNGVYALEYFWIYNAKLSFSKFIQHFSLEKVLDFIIENCQTFLEKCFIYFRLELINIILSSSKSVSKINEILQGLISQYSGYENSLLIQNCNLALKSQTPNFIFPNKKTGFIFNSDNLKHIKLPEDPFKHMIRRNEMFENSDRLSTLISKTHGVLRWEYFTNNPNFVYKETNRKSCLADILKCHDISYISKIKDKCSEIQNDDTHVQIDADTLISSSTYNNIYLTTGCVMEAIDMVMNKEINNAFAIIRPPGHHVGYFGAVDNVILPKSNGFCIVNNVCVGAAYCKYKYKDEIKKIAIVDFDVHHGNGTEEIVQLLNNKKYSFNASNDIGDVTVTKNLTKPWVDYDDAKNVLFISLHVYNESNPKSFYPYTGSSETNTKKNSEIYPGGVLNIPFVSNMKYSYEYRDLFRKKVIPRLYNFEPDFIFISAGFDGHENETINGGNMLLQEYDFAFVTEQLQQVANKFCQGRVVSVLEGGYNVKTGIISSFAQSAMMHALYLNLAVNMESFGDILLTKMKRKREYDKDYEIFKHIERFDKKPRRSERIKHMEEEKEHNQTSNSKHGELNDTQNEVNNEKERNKKDGSENSECNGDEEQKQKNN